MQLQIKIFALAFVIKEKTAAHVLQIQGDVFGVKTLKNASYFLFTPVNISLGDVVNGLTKLMKANMPQIQHLLNAGNVINTYTAQSVYKI